MFVHADQSRNNGMPGQVHAPGAGRNKCSRRASQRGNLSVINNDGLIFGGGCSGSVKDTHVHQCNYWIVDADERLNPRLKTILLLGGHKAIYGQKDKNSAHVPTVVVIHYSRRESSDSRTYPK